MPDGSFDVVMPKSKVLVVAIYLPPSRGYRHTAHFYFTFGPYRIIIAYRGGIYKCVKKIYAV